MRAEARAPYDSDDVASPRSWRTAPRWPSTTRASIARRGGARRPCASSPRPAPCSSSSLDYVVDLRAAGAPGGAARSPTGAASTWSRRRRARPGRHRARRPGQGRARARAAAALSARSRRAAGRARGPPHRQRELCAEITDGDAGARRARRRSTCASSSELGSALGADRAAGGARPHLRRPHPRLGRVESPLRPRRIVALMEELGRRAGFARRERAPLRRGAARR